MSKNLVNSRIVCLAAFMLFQAGSICGQELLKNELNDHSNITILNSRFGSRFTFSLSMSECGVRTGSLGFDMDELTDFYIGIDDSSGSYLMRTSNRPNGSSYFKDQKLEFGLTYSEIEGYTNSGIRTAFEIISPFTTSRDLQDIDNIKIQTAPAFYFIVRVKNESTQLNHGRVKVALRKTAINSYNELAVRNYNTNLQTLYFKDTGGRDSRLVLSTANKNYQVYYNDKGFNGLLREYLLQPGEELIDTLVFAAYHQARILRDLRVNQDLKFHYTKYWKNIEEVLSYSLNNAQENLSVTRKFEHVLAESSATPEEKWISSLSFHNDLACSFFLLDELDRPRFYLVEGRFQHLSTIDVAHETEIMALFAPWRLKIQMEQWTKYLALKQVRVPSNPVLNKDSYLEGYSASEFGPFLYHDVGDLPFVDASSNYNYGPHMAVEENSDFVLLLYFYWKLTGDDEFVRSMLGLTDVLLQSMMNRDTNQNGIADMGHGWTTYDVNQVLKTAPDNTYLGIKQACAYLTASEMFTELSVKHTSNDVLSDNKSSIIHDGEGSAFTSHIRLNNGKLRKAQALKYTQEAEKIIFSLAQAYKKYDYVPLSLDTSVNNWDQSSVVVGEGLFLPGMAGCKAPQLLELARILAKDYKKSYEKSLTVYGLKLSTAEDPTWFSKTMVSDLVGTYWYSTSNSTAAFAYMWNKNNPFAYNDGAFDADTQWTGYWYPRGVCSIGYLFRDEKLTVNQIMERIERLIQSQTN